MDLAADSKNKELKKFFKKSLEENFINTSTVIDYNPGSRKDDAHHNYGMNKIYSLVSENIVGPDEGISESKDPKYLEAILGTADVNKINNVFSSITHRKVKIWRFNEKPDEIISCVVGLDLNQDRLNLNLNRNLGVSKFYIKYKTRFAPLEWPCSFLNIIKISIFYSQKYK